MAMAAAGFCGGSVYHIPLTGFAAASTGEKATDKGRILGLKQLSELHGDF